MKKTLGVSHETSHASATSPTASSPDDHTVDGADRSECDFLGFNKKPPAKQLKQLRTAKKPVPAGLGVLVVSTDVRDDDPLGDGPNWSPTSDALDWNQGLLNDKTILGGGSFSVPGFASFLHNQLWLGNKDRTAGYYQVGDGQVGGVIVITVDAPTGAFNRYRTFAKKLVPAFTQEALAG